MGTLEAPDNPTFSEHDVPGDGFQPRVGHSTSPVDCPIALGLPPNGQGDLANPSFQGDSLAAFFEVSTGGEPCLRIEQQRFRESFREVRFVPLPLWLRVARMILPAVASFLLVVGILIGGYFGLHRYRTGQGEVHVARAVEDFEKRNFEQAAVEYERALAYFKVPPDYTKQREIYLELARCASALSDHRKAIERYREALELGDSEDLQSSLERSFRLLALENFEQSLQATRRGELDSAERLAKSALLDFYAGKASEAQLAGALRQLGRVLLSQGYLSAAEPYIIEAEKIDKSNPNTTNLLADFRRAKTLAEKASPSVPAPRASRPRPPAPATSRPPTNSSPAVPSRPPRKSGPPPSFKVNDPYPKYQPPAVPEPEEGLNLTLPYQEGYSPPVQAPQRSTQPVPARPNPTIQPPSPRHPPALPSGYSGARPQGGPALPAQPYPRARPRAPEPLVPTFPGR